MSTEKQPDPMSGAELALRLFGAFRAMVDELHAELARQGHPGVRPVHGFALQALDPGGTTAAELGSRLGVSKQAAGKTVQTLEAQGYVTRSTDPDDARRQVVTVTSRGHDLLGCSATAFEQLRRDRTDRIGEETMRAVETGLRGLGTADGFRLDAAGWFGS